MILITIPGHVFSLKILSVDLKLKVYVQRQNLLNKFFKTSQRNKALVLMKVNLWNNFPKNTYLKKNIAKESPNGNIHDCS